MGNFESNMNNLMDHENDSDSSEDIEIGYDMLNMYLDYDSTESDYYSNDDLLNILLQRFINTDHQFNFHGSSPAMRFKLPQIKAKLNLDSLKKNSIYQSIKYSSGYGLEDSNPLEKWSLVKMISNRQCGVGGKNGSYTQPQRCKISNNFLPNDNSNLFSMEKKIFCGTFTPNGNHFVTASQDSMIRVYDSSTPRYNQVNVINAKDVNWCILDIGFSSNNEHFVYSTWSPSLYLSRIDGKSIQLQPLCLQPTKSSFCIFSVAFAENGKEVIGGGSDGCLYIYDLVENRRTLQIPVASETMDVNAVGFIDENSNIIYSAADNGVIKIWDRRSLDESTPKDVGMFMGHLDGVTYIDSKKDGRYLISNSKDQTIKLWDLRVFAKGETSPSSTRQTRSRWDYRWDDVPKEFYTDTIKLPEDTSVMTYRGHKVKKTLIRAKFSPQETTGQRYIYTGCGTGRLIIYDVLTGKMVYQKRAHNEIVRDVSWHPLRNEILTSSWDFNVCLHSYKQSIPTLLKRCLSEVEKESTNSARDDGQGPPPRRSRRLALRRQARE